MIAVANSYSEKIQAARECREVAEGYRALIEVHIIAAVRLEREALAALWDSSGVPKEPPRELLGVTGHEATT